MTGPEDPGDDWGFPEVDPASTRLPPAEGYDTGSDAWWRAQAEAQRRAAASEPVLPPSPPAAPEAPEPPPLVEPEVLDAPSPLDQGWVPPELAEPVAAAPVAAEPEPVAHEPEPVAYEEPVASEEPVAYEPEPVPYEEHVPYEEEHRVAEDPQRVSPGRALLGAAIALLGVLLAIGSLIFFHGDKEPQGTPTVALPPTSSVTAPPTTAPTTEPTPPATTPPPKPSPTAPAVVATTPAAQAPVVPVRVLNNSRISGLAERSAARFRNGGWPVPQTGNYSGGTIRTTTVYYPAGQQASAQRFARQFGIPRVAPRFPGIPVPGMTVIVTRDYA